VQSLYSYYHCRCVGKFSNSSPSCAAWAECRVLLLSNVLCRYNKINVMHFSFNLLRIKGLYMYRALLTYPQEVLNTRHLVHCMRRMSVGCGTFAVNSLQLCYRQLTLYARNKPGSVCVTPPEDKQVMLNTC
jgi:hypothetical protein